MFEVAEAKFSIRGPTSRGAGGFPQKGQSPTAPRVRPPCGYGGRWIGRRLWVIVCLSEATAAVPAVLLLKQCVSILCQELFQVQ